MIFNAYSVPESVDTLADVGRCFRALRKAAGKTQTDVARLVGMRQEALSRFESGAGADFSLAKLLRLLQALDLEMAFNPAVRRPTLDEVLLEVKQGHNSGPDAR